MGRTCRICDRERPHEQFGGKGYSASVCKKCRGLPKSEQQRILATDEVIGFLLNQKNISTKNIKRLEALATIDDAGFQTLRALVLEIALVKPHKRRRRSFLRDKHPDLYRRAVDAELIEEIDFYEPPEYAANADYDFEFSDPDTTDSKYEEGFLNEAGEHDDIPF